MAWANWKEWFKLSFKYFKYNSWIYLFLFSSFPPLSVIAPMATHVKDLTSVPIFSIWNHQHLHPTLFYLSPWISVSCNFKQINTNTKCNIFTSVLQKNNCKPVQLSARQEHTVAVLAVLMLASVYATLMTTNLSVSACITIERQVKSADENGIKKLLLQFPF